MVTAGFYVWDSQNIVPTDDTTRTQSRSSHTNVNFVVHGPKVSVGAVLSNVHPVKLENPVPASISEGSTNSPEPIEYCDSTLSDEINKAEFVRVGSTSLGRQRFERQRKLRVHAAVQLQKLRDSRYCHQFWPVH